MLALQLTRITPDLLVTPMQRPGKARAMAVSNSIISTRRSHYVVWTRDDAQFVGDFRGVVGSCVAIISMLAYTFIPAFRKSRLVRFLTERDQNHNA